MAKIQTIDKTKADFNDIMEVTQNAVMSRINCHGVGKITEFDKTAQTATIQLMQLKQFANEIYTPAPLTEVPLIIYGNEQSGITLPDPTGTICLVFFLDRNIDNFILTGEMYQPETSRMHDFSDCIAITTFKTLANPIENYDENALTLYHNRIVEEIAYTAIIKNYANSLLLQVLGDENISKVNIINNSLLLQTSNDENTSKFNIASKFNMQNSSYSLATLIQNLITAIKAIVVNTSTGALLQSSKDNLDEVAQDFQGLLE